MIGSLMLLSAILKVATVICHAALKRHLLFEFLNKCLPVAKTVVFSMVVETPRSWVQIPGKSTP